jgi:hypothetical protein
MLFRYRRLLKYLFILLITLSVFSNYYFVAKNDGNDDNGAATNTVYNSNNSDNNNNKNNNNNNNSDSITSAASSHLEILSKNTNTTKGKTTTTSTKAIIGEVTDSEDKMNKKKIKDEHRKIIIVPRVWRLIDDADAAVIGDASNSKNNIPPADDAVMSFPCADYGPFLRTSKKQYKKIMNIDTIFPLWPPIYDNSKPDHSSYPEKKGLLFIKPMKTGGSTASGIHLRISKNIAERRRDYMQQQRLHDPYNNITAAVAISITRIVTNSTDYPPPKNNNNSNNISITTDSSTTLLCSNHFWHSRSALMFENRSRTQSFLWTLLRDPINRVMSEFYHFFVTRQHIEPTDDNLIALLSNNSIKNTNYYIKLHNVRKNQNKLLKQSRRKQKQERCRGMQNITQGIIDDYDFIAITERFDESMVVMQLILENRYGIGVVTLGDMLYLNAKVSGGYDDGGYKSTCYKILKPPPIKDWSRRLKNYLYKNSNSNTTATSTNGSNELQLQRVDPWMDRIEHDLALWEAANISLDRTIDALGRKHVFEPRLQQYRDAQDVVQKRCGNEARFPCDEITGKKRKPKDTNCLYSDSGCAYQCLDQTAKDLGI